MNAGTLAQAGDDEKDRFGRTARHWAEVSGGWGLVEDKTGSWWKYSVEEIEVKS